MSALRILALGLLAICLGAGAGCSSAPPPEKKDDPDALKRELDDLNKARKKEWKQ